jgi:hypothetical protein
VKAGLLIGRTEEDRLCVLLGVDGGCGVELEALGDLVVELDLVAERVVGRPGLSDGQAVGLVGVLALEVTRDERGFRVADSVDLEGDVRRSRGFNLEGCTVEVVVLAEEVIGGLAKVLYACIKYRFCISKKRYKKTSCPPAGTKKRADEPSRTGERVEGEASCSDEGVERRGC